MLKITLRLLRHIKLTGVGLPDLLGPESLFSGECFAAGAAQRFIDGRIRILNFALAGILDSDLCSIEFQN